MDMKKTIFAGTVAFGITLTGVGLTSVSAYDYPGNPVKSGNNDDNVSDVQKQLSDRGYSLETDGIFGPRTADDVKDFQNVSDLSVDGIVGPKTWNVMWNNSNGASQMLKTGSNGQEVKDLQSQINDAGYNAGNVDGVYGSLTKQAVMDFQQKNDLAADGINGPKTQEALDDSDANAASDQDNGNANTSKQEDGTASVNIPKKTLMKGDEGKAVGDLQSTLSKMGYETDKNNTYGEKTQASVTKVQEKSDLNADGVYGPKTRKAVETIASGK